MQEDIINIEKKRNQNFLHKILLRENYFMKITKILQKMIDFKYYLVMNQKLILNRPMKLHG